jgi:hypothetical protein
MPTELRSIFRQFHGKPPADGADPSAMSVELLRKGKTMSFLFARFYRPAKCLPATSRCHAPKVLRDIARQGHS